MSYPGYRWYWIGAVLGPLGVFMQMVARNWLIYNMTDSAFLLGVVMACMGIPVIVITPFAGVYADRLDKRKQMMIAESIIFISSLIMTILLYLDIIEVWHIIATALVMGMGMAFSLPSRMAIISELLEKEHLMNGIAVYNMGTNIMRIMGPVLGGVLVGLVDIKGVFLISTILYLFVPTTIFMIRQRNIIKDEGKAHPLQDLIEGFKYIIGDRNVLILILFGYVISFLGYNYLTFLPVFVRDIYHLDAAGLGYMTGAAGVGALISATAIAWLGNVKHKGAFLLAVCLAFGLAILAFAYTGMYQLALILLLLIGGMYSLSLMLSQTLIQSISKPEMLGRALSIYIISFGLQMFAGIPAGAVAEYIGTPFTIALCGILIALFTVLVGLLTPHIRKL